MLQFLTREKVIKIIINYNNNDDDDDVHKVKFNTNTINYDFEVELIKTSSTKDVCNSWLLLPGTLKISTIQKMHFSKFQTLTFALTKPACFRN